VAVVRVADLAEEIRVRSPLLGGVAEDRLELGAHVRLRARAFGPVDVDSQRALIDEGLKPVVKQLPVGVGHRMLPGRWDSSVTAGRPCSKPRLLFTPVNLETPDVYAQRRAS